jgi:predicted MFS family arabinose efflux permease
MAEMSVRPSLRNPRFAALLVAEAVNSIGSWASAIALWGFAAYRFDATSGQVSLLIICWSVPVAVLGPPLGVVVDRLGARRALILAYLLGAGAALGLAAANSLLVLDLLAVLAGCARALAGPASSALPPQIVAPDALISANSLLGGATEFGQVLGPLVASAALALSGFRAAFLVDAATFAIGVAALLPLPSRRPAREARAPWLSELVDGFRIVVRQRSLRLMLLIGAAVSFTSGAFLVVEPLYARHVLHRPPSQFALFEAAAGIGAILTGLVLPQLTRFLEWRGTLSVAAVAYGLTACLFVGTTWVAVAYTGAFLWGVSGMVFGVVVVTAIQRLAAVETHGRVFALDSALGSIAETVGLAIAGAAIALLGVRLGAFVLAAVTIIAGLVTAPTLAECLRPDVGAVAQGEAAPE